MFFAFVQQFKKQLAQLDRWMVLAEEHAQAKSFDVNVLVHARLAPDQFAFVRQVQSACDNAKLATARLAGKTAPSHPDTEQTFAELHARVRAVIEYLGTFTEADFAEAATRVISQPRWEGKVMSGADYFVEYAVPNFYFHLTHVYAILRHSGVNVGKRDYLGQVTMRAP